MKINHIEQVILEKIHKVHSLTNKYPQHLYLGFENFRELKNGYEDRLMFMIELKDCAETFSKEYRGLKIHEVIEKDHINVC